MTMESSSPYRADIDGLRAIAILLVVGFHAFPDYLTGGYVGVDVFFVISGFLITGIILRARENHRFSYVEFYLRRIRRIFPALLVVLGLTFVFGWYVLLPNEFAQLERHLASAAGFGSNFELWSEAGYFDTSANTKPLQHLWSLAIEEQFYIVWPLLLGLTWSRRKALILATLAIALASFAFNVWLVGNDSIGAFYSPLSRAWELMAGGLLAEQSLRRGDFRTRQNRLPGWLNLQSAAGLTLLIAAAALLESNSTFPGWWALLPTGGTVLMIAAGPNAWLNAKLFGRREMVWIGRISYPLYLWHWPILVFMRMVLERNLVIVDKLIAIAISFCLATVTYVVLERPIQRRPLKWSARLLGTGMAAILLIALACVHFALSPRNDDEGISKYLAATYDWDYPDGLEHRIFAGALRRAYAYDSRLSSRTLFFGDSNMEQYFPRIRHLIDDAPDKFNSAVLVGNQRQRCFAIVQIFLKTENDCGSVMHDITNLALAKETDTVALIYGSMSYEFLMRTDVGYARFGAFINSMKQNGKRVFVVLSMPDGEELDPRNMFSGSRLTRLEAKPVGDIKFKSDDYFKRWGAARNKVARDAADNGAIVIDPFKTLCDGTSCPVFDENGLPLYKDWLHMRASYVLKSAKYIDQTLLPLHPVPLATN